MIFIIHIIDDWYVDADESCYTLGKLVLRTDKEGKEKQLLINTSYHKTVAQACNSLLQRYQRKLVEQNAYELKDAVRAFTAIETTFKNLLPVDEKI